MIKRKIDRRSRVPLRGTIPIAILFVLSHIVLAQVDGPTITDGTPTTQPDYHSGHKSPTTFPATAPADRLAITTWAASGVLKNPVALTFDRQGRAYVAETQRREGGELQTRSDPLHRVIPDHTFFSLDDKLRWAGDGDPGWGQQTGGKKETIHLLEDTKGVGKADKVSVFYQGFNKNEADILAGVLWNEGSVYATIAPDLWMLKDTKGIGTADEVRSLSHGYGVHMSYSGHNMHGLAVGPDGKIYFTIADKALNITTAEGHHLNYPYCGCCLRCNLDGSDLEVFAYGLRNVQEVAFDKYGNLFGVDNDGDFPTERERLVYIAQDSDSGWRFNWQYRSKSYDVANAAADRKARYNPWMDEKLWVPYFAGQAAYITPPLANYTDGPCGFKYASEGSLNERYRGYFFVTEFPKATVRAFALKPKGAYFTMNDDRIVSRGIQCTGLAFGPDGALYGAEWGKSGFKLGNTGSVIKLDDPAAAETPLRKGTHELLRAGPYQRSIAELIELLANEDMRVRLDAQFELVRRKSVDAFEQIAISADKPQMARIHALWGLGQFVSSKTLDAATSSAVANNLLLNCSDKDPEIRAQSVKLLGELAASRLVTVSTELPIQMLQDPSLRVRFFAAMALGKLGDRNAVQSLLRLISENRPVDPYIRYAGVMGLVGIADADGLLANTSNSSPDIRLAVVVALRRLKNPGVARFLHDRDPLVATEAARAIHDDFSIPDALPALAEAVTRTDIPAEAFIRRALNANLRVGGADSINRLVEYATNEKRPSAMRVEAVDILASWEQPVVNDRVEGWYRTWPQRSAMGLRKALDSELPSLVASKDADVARATTRLIERLAIKTDDSVFAKWVTDPDKPATSRVAALHLLAIRKYSKLTKLTDAALASKEPALRSEGLRVLADHDPEHAVEQVTKTLADGSTPEKQAALRVLGTLNIKEAETLLNDWMEQLIDGKVAPELQLDLLEAAGALKDSDVQDKVAKYEASLPKSDPLARYTPSLQGGDAERGKSIFNGDGESACIRCHSVDGTGSSVGPNLAGISSNPQKPRHYILESMIDPNAFIVPGYGMASFALKDGSDVSGMVKSENDTTVQLLGLEGEATTLKKSDIAARTPPASVMPPMGAVLSPSEIRDVIEYLSSLKKN
jgi:putative membrane-bound dehydrogenase-like protein